MATIKSVFGVYSDKLQMIIDKRLDAFAPTFFQQYFDFGIPQTNLTFVDVIGRSRVEAAASIITRGSKSPIRSRNQLDKLTGDIPNIGVKYQMLENDYRNFLSLQSMPVSEETKKKAALDLLFDDMKKVGDAPLKRIDYMVLEGLSTGQITISITNNPDGYVAPTPIDLLMPSINKTNAAVAWTSPTTATPITDIRNKVEAAKARGQVFDKILMDSSLWLKFIATTEVKDLYGAYLGKANNKVIPTIDTVNEFLTGLKLPTIETVNVAIGIEKDGVITTVNPFSTTNAVFIPAGRLGKIHNAFSVEELKPVEGIKYGKFQNILISKWQENEPWAEWTKSELNAFPGFETIDGIHLLSTTLAFP